MPNFQKIAELEQEREHVERQRQGLRAIIPADRSVSEWRHLSELTKRLQQIDIALQRARGSKALAEFKKTHELDDEGIYKSKR